MPTDQGGAVDADQCTATPGILSDVKVLDLSRVLAGPYCTQMLADQGADVVKVEGPEGDDTRGWGPPFIENGNSAYFEGLNRNKRNICLDLRTEPGREVLRRLIHTSDVVVENFKPGTLARWGLDYETTLAPQYPGLIYCQISGFGVSGPLSHLPGYDAVLQSYGGLMSINGYADRGPLRVGVPIVDITAANLAFAGILLALRHRERTSLGQLVDVSLLDAVISLLHPHSAVWLASGQAPERTGEAHPLVAPYQVFPTRTGDVFVSAANDRQFAALVTELGHSELATDERFVDNAARVQNRVALVALLGQLFATRDRDELMVDLSVRGVPAAPVNTVGEALASEQVRHRELLVEADGYRGLGVPIKLGRSRPTPPRPPAPRGADRDEVLASLGYDQLETDRLRASGAFGS